MATIIAVLNPKGGSGKTTLSTNLASALHQCGETVLLADTDVQASARDWHSESEDNPLTIVGLDRASSLKGLDTISKPYDYVVLDGESKVQEMVAAAISAADIVLIPCQPSPYDVWACADLAELIRTRQQVTDGQPRAAFVITRSMKRTKLGNEITEALGEYGLPVFDRQIMQRQIYPQSASEGKSVIDTGNLEATTEIHQLTNELLEFIRQEETHGALSEEI